MALVEFDVFFRSFLMGSDKLRNSIIIIILLFSDVAIFSSRTQDVSILTTTTYKVGWLKVACFRLVEHKCHMNEPPKNVFVFISLNTSCAITNPPLNYHIN